MKQLRIFLFSLFSLLLVPGLLAAKDRKRPAAKKATVRTTVTLPPLSYNDSRRYDFFFLEAIRQQEVDTMMQPLTCSTIVLTSIPTRLTRGISKPCISPNSSKTHWR